MRIFQNVPNGLIPARLTVAEVYALQEQGVIDESERFELIGGEIRPMAAAKFNQHEAMKSALNRALVMGTSPDLGVFVEASLTLSDATFVEPDLAIWPRSIGTQDIRAPDVLLLIEVAVSWISYDVGEKARLYAAAGLRDYWVVDAARRAVRVHRKPGSAGFEDVEEYGSDDDITALLLPGLTVRLANLI